MVEGLEHMKVCRNCKKELPADIIAGRRDTCPSCGSDVHVCRNCRFYDPGAYNQCHEDQAERVIDKERSNACEYFEFDISARNEIWGTKQHDVREQLEALFKK